MIDCPTDLTLALGLNYPEFPDSSFRFDLPFRVDVLQMLADGLDRNLIELGDLRLREPYRIAFQSHLDAGLRILAAVQDQFRSRCFHVVSAHAISQA
jgi:hypothetical protein